MKRVLIGVILGLLGALALNELLQRAGSGQPQGSQGSEPPDTPSTRA